MTREIKPKGKVERFVIAMASGYGSPAALAKHAALSEADVVDALERGFDESPFATVRAILDALHMNMHYGMEGLVIVGRKDARVLEESIEQLNQQRIRLDNLIGDAKTLEDAKGAWQMRNAVGKALSCLKKWMADMPKLDLLEES